MRAPSRPGRSVPQRIVRGRSILRPSCRGSRPRELPRPRRAWSSLRASLAVRSRSLRCRRRLHTRRLRHLRGGIEGRSMRRIYPVFATAGLRRGRSLRAGGSCLVPSEHRGCGTRLNTVLFATPPAPHRGSIADQSRVRAGGCAGVTRPVARHTIRGTVRARHCPGARLALSVLLCAAGCSDHASASADASTDSGGDYGRDAAIESDAEAGPLACTMPADCRGPVLCCIGGFCSDAPPASCADAGELAIMVSSYDQSCSVDSDCTTAANVSTCFGPIRCDYEPIAKSALAQYQSDVAMLPPSPCMFFVSLAPRLLFSARYSVSAARARRAR
jgi:hypothetical protein